MQQENGRRRVPGTLPPKAVSRCLGIQRTKLYDEIRAGNVAIVDPALTGRSYEVLTLWVLEQMSSRLGREVSLDELADFLPEELLR